MTKNSSCPDCNGSLNRRGFLQTVGSAALVGVAAPHLIGTQSVWSAPTATSPAETAVLRFYKSLSDEQRKTIVLPFDHELRRRINANWHVTKPVLDDDFYTKEQRAIVDEIVRNVTSADGYGRIQKQTEEDSGGIGAYSVAIFGEPGSGKFEWELTGRHLTLRADGNSVDQAAFGGPLIYGHGVEEATKNLFYYQTKQVNEVFGALDTKQREKALVKAAPTESDVDLQGEKGKFPGISLKDFSADQKKLVEATLKTLLAPYREADVEEVFAILKASGGIDSLNLAFYQEGDLANDQVWDIWRVEGPAFVWHFRGAPHVHAYINIAGKA